MIRVWLDIEATGLDIDINVPLEVGVVLTEGFDILTEQNWLLACAEYEMENLHPEVVEMHTSNGLFDEVRADAVLTVREVDHQLCQWMEAQMQGQSAWHICGASIWWDRKVLERFFPAFENRLHHRMIDVSSINESIGEWAPDLYDHRPRGNMLHRAVPDCKDSFELWKYYKYMLLGDA